METRQPYAGTRCGPCRRRVAGGEPLPFTLYQSGTFAPDSTNRFDAFDRDGRRRQHRRRLQRFRRDDLPGDPTDGTVRGGSAWPDGRRRHDVRRHAARRSGLKTAGVTTARWWSIRRTAARSGTPTSTTRNRFVRLEDSHRVVQVRDLRRPDRHDRGHGQRRREPARGGYGRRRSLQHDDETWRVTTSSLLPVGTYDMTATKYGFLQGSARMSR